MFIKILGFDPSGAPILPNTAKSNDPDVIRREKMGWEEISQRAAKVVSFSGGHHTFIALSITITLFRSGWTRTIFENNAIRLDIWGSLMCHANGRSQRWTHRHVQGAFSYSAGFERPSYCLHYQSMSLFLNHTDIQMLTWIPCRSI